MCNVPYGGGSTKCCSQKRYKDENQSIHKPSSAKRQEVALRMLISFVWLAMKRDEETINMAAKRDASYIKEKTNISGISCSQLGSTNASWEGGGI